MDRTLSPRSIAVALVVLVLLSLPVGGVGLQAAGSPGDVDLRGTTEGSADETGTRNAELLAVTSSLRRASTRPAPALQQETATPEPTPTPTPSPTPEPTPTPTETP
ncbi:MAG: hypothetical protein V5A85_12460, partial [Haloarculaceae archaeon]